MKLLKEGRLSVPKTVMEKYTSRGPKAKAKNGRGSLRLASMHVKIEGTGLSNSQARACRSNANNTTATESPAICEQETLIRNFCHRILLFNSYWVLLREIKSNVILVLSLLLPLSTQRTQVAK